MNRARQIERAVGALNGRVGTAAITAAITAALVACVALPAAGLVALGGVSPLDAAQTFWNGAFGDPERIGQTVTNAVPLVLVALGWIVVFRAGRIHIGFPGQIMIGGLFAAVVALELDGLPPVLHVSLAMLAGVAGGGLYAALAAYLWAGRGVQEIVSTLLLNLVAAQIVAWALRGPLRESVGAQPQTDPFPASSHWPTVSWIDGQTLSWDVVLVPVLVVAVMLVLARTTLGFRLRLVGANPVAARYAGYSPVKIGVMAIVASGLFAGLAGAALLLAGESPGMVDGFEGEYGFNGIAVALLARNSPPWVFLGALIFSALDIGMSSVEALHGVPSTISSVLQGLIILLVLVSATVIQRRNSGASGLRTPEEPESDGDRSAVPVAASIGGR